MENAIFGYTGLVGSYLTKFYKCENFYNSSNITESVNKNFNIIFISCIPAVKWLANKEPEHDYKTIENIENIFKTITANRVILISTIDVYDNIKNKSNEDTIIDINKNHTYGRNRYLFEQFIKSNFNNVFIFRLPALFGRGLKKNLIYDLLNQNNLNNINPNTYFQWYDLEWLKNDIDLCIDNNIYECNLFTEPLKTQKILEMFPEYNLDPCDDHIFGYDVTTKFWKYFPDGYNGYIRDKEIVYNNLKKFILSRRSNKYKLCISNVSNNNLSNIQYYSILKHYSINNIEIAPTKFDTWESLFNSYSFNCENLHICSFQSIAYGIDRNLFKDDEQNDLFEHLKKVIDLAASNNVKNLVFGCPKNRYIADPNIDNDKIFVDFLTKVGNYIGERDLIISIENNSKKYNCNYLNTIEQVGSIVTRINHPKIKMMIDIGNCIMEDDILENIKIYKDFINHIHISMPFMKSFKSYNKIEFSKFSNLLKEIYYDKILSLEFLNNSGDLENLVSSIENFIEFSNI